MAPAASAPLTVAHVGWLSEVGGGELFLLDLVGRVDPARVRQRVLCLGPGGPPLARLAGSAAEVTQLRRGERSGLAMLARLALALRRERPHVVQTHGEAGVFWGLPAACLARCPATAALVYQCEPSARRKMAALRALLPRATAVVAGSAAVRRFVVGALGVPEERSLVVHCGIDPAPFRTAAAARQAAPHRRRRPVVVAVGRLVPQKGHDVLLRAFARCGPARGAELWLVGDGPRRRRLAELAAALGISALVTFHGTVHPTCELLAAADVFAFPSLAEPQGLALLEAFAAGVPVVASRTGGVVEMVEDGRDGVLVPPGEVEPLAAALAALLDDPERGRRLAAAAQARLAAFDIRAVARRYERLWAALAAGGDAAAAAAAAEGEAA
jgi:glycosyltransferase involved in cell wall biosynthesis